MKLITPSIKYKNSYYDYIKELGSEERYPFPLDFESKDFDAMIQRNLDFKQGINIPSGFVPSSTYWMICKDNIIGVSNLRHVLNQRIKHCGGHIGLGIRPTYRGKGLGTKLMELTIKKAISKNINTIHIHCHEHNTASICMILANGGTLDSDCVDESGQKVLRYSICT